MTKAATFTMTMDEDLRAAFVAAAAASHRQPAQVVEDLMRAFVDRQSGPRAHGAFLRQKVAAARASARQATGRTNEAVEAEFSERRRKVLGVA